MKKIDRSEQFNSYQIRRIAKVNAYARRLQSMLFKIDPSGNTGSPASVMEDQLQGFIDSSDEVLIDAIRQSKINISKVY